MTGQSPGASAKPPFRLRHVILSLAHLLLSPVTTRSYSFPEAVSSLRWSLQASPFRLAPRWSLRASFVRPFPVSLRGRRIASEAVSPQRFLAASRLGRTKEEGLGMTDEECPCEPHFSPFERSLRARLFVCEAISPLRGHCELVVSSAKQSQLSGVIANLVFSLSEAIPWDCFASLAVTHKGSHCEVVVSSPKQSQKHQKHSENTGLLRAFGPRNDQRKESLRGRCFAWRSSLNCQRSLRARFFVYEAISSLTLWEYGTASLRSQ